MIGFSNILLALERIGADTIVIGSHGRGGLERVQLRSVAEGLMRVVEKVGVALDATPHGDSSQQGWAAQ